MKRELIIISHLIELSDRILNKNILISVDFYVKGLKTQNLMEPFVILTGR